MKSSILSSNAASVRMQLAASGMPRTNKLGLSLAAALAVAGMATSTFGASITVSTVGTYAPNPNSLTIRDAGSNADAASGITLSAFQTLITNAFADNTGGVWNADSSSGISYSTNYGEDAANAITAKYGTSQANLLSFYRTDSAPNVAFSNVANGTQTVSGDGIIGFSQDSAPNIAFSQSLSALGLTLVPRSSGEARSATLVAVLDDATTLTSTTESVSLNDPVFFGFVAPVGRTIVGLNITPGGGFARFDDLGFVTAVPEPTTGAMLLGGFGLLGMLRRRRVA
jgi:hypothetical protein